MLCVDLSEEEKVLLSSVLVDVLKDMSYEIAETDVYDFRALLKVKRDALAKVKTAVDSAQVD